jgi:hypothetical protein
MSREEKIEIIVNEGSILLKMLGLTETDLSDFTDEQLDSHVSEVRGEEY